MQCVLVRAIDFPGTEGHRAVRAGGDAAPVAPALAGRSETTGGVGHLRAGWSAGIGKHVDIRAVAQIAVGRDQRHAEHHGARGDEAVRWILIP